MDNILGLFSKSIIVEIIVGVLATLLIPLSVRLEDLASAAGKSIAYATPAQNQKVQTLRAMFDSLGDEIDRRL